MLSWRLIYADGSSLDEPDDGGTILESWPDPIELHLVQDGKAIRRVNLDGWKPIFYRQRSMIAQSSMVKSAIGLGNGIFSSPVLASSASDARLDATVFGRGQDGDTVETQLWACINGEIVPCPKKHIAMGAIRHQVATQRAAIV